jgi:membrane-bound lytic murein transglycosylase D
MRIKRVSVMNAGANLRMPCAGLAKKLARHPFHFSAIAFSVVSTAALLPVCSSANAALVQSPAAQSSVSETETGDATTETRQDEDALPAFMQSWQSGLQEGASVFLTPTEVLSEAELKEAVAWQPPSYDGQNGALGWDEHTFDVPEKMKSRVAFWREIYGRYTTDQGLLHDASHLEIVYGPVDFTSITRSQTMTSFQKARAREALVKERKKEIVERLKRLSQRTSGDGLTGEDLRVWKMFENVQESGGGSKKARSKFLAAADKSRVRFQLGQKDRFILGIFYSGRYLREMEQIFRSEGLPIELTRLPFVESSFNIHARSKVGASGVWQFMPRTAKSYLRLNKLIDERNDPWRATVASARLLKQNFLMLGTWGLALTGYNHGPYGVRGIVNKLGTKDIAEIIDRYSSRSFGFASENFYACFLAALAVEKNARTYFGDVRWSAVTKNEEVPVTRSFPYQTLVDFYDGDAASANLMNLHFTARVKTGKDLIPVGTFVRVPPSRLQIAKDFMAGQLSGVSLALALSAQAPLKSSGSKVASASEQGSSSTSSGVRAKLEKLTSTAAAIFPRLTGRPAATPIPLPPSMGPAQPEVTTVTNTVATPTQSASQDIHPDVDPVPAPAVLEPRLYKVQPGDSLFAIAKKHGVTLGQIEALNELNHSAHRKGAKRVRLTLRPGQMIKLPPAASQETSN